MTRPLLWQNKTCSVKDSSRGAALFLKRHKDHRCPPDSRKTVPLRLRQAIQVPERRRPSVSKENADLCRRRRFRSFPTAEPTVFVQRSRPDSSGSSVSGSGTYLINFCKLVSTSAKESMEEWFKFSLHYLKWNSPATTPVRRSVCHNLKGLEVTLLFFYRDMCVLHVVCFQPIVCLLSL